MGFWSRVADILLGKTDKMSIEDWWENYGPSTRSVTGIAVTQISAMQVSTVLSCVSILSEDVAKLPIHVIRRLEGGGKQIVDDHPIEILFRRPNGFQSSFEFVEQMQAALLLRGNGYACIIRNGRGVPIAMIPVNPDRVSIFEAQDGSVFYMVARRGPHDIAMLKSLPLMVPAEEMIHLRWMAMDNSLWGVSRIGLAREAIALALSQQELAGRMSANSTNLGGVLTTDGKLTPEAAIRIATDWKKNKAGLANAGDTVVLEQGLKWERMGMTSSDAEFIASRNLQIEEIARLFRMPLHKLGVVGRGIGGSLEALDQDYMNSVVSSYLRRWEEKIDQTFGLAAQGLSIEFDISGFLRASLQVRYNAYRTGIVGMFLTPNEARRAEGLPDHPNGDTLYQPTNVAPIGFDPSSTPGATGPGSDVTGAPAPGGHGDPAAVPDDPPEDVSPTG